MPRNILVTGATGHVGSEVARLLLGAGHSVVLASRRPSNQRSTQETAVAVPFDFRDSATFGPALRDVDAVFLLRPPALGNVKRDFEPFVTAMRNAGVQTVVFLSVAGVAANPYVPHNGIERLLTASGLKRVFLRAGFFAQNFEEAYRSDILASRLRLPAAHAKVTFVDVRDLAEVAARFLVSPPRVAETALTLTGPEALTFHEAVTHLGRELGREIRYDPVNVLSYLRHARSQGVSWELSFIQTWLHWDLRRGTAATVSPDLAGALGRPPRTLAHYFRDFRHVWDLRSSPDSANT